MQLQMGSAVVSTAAVGVPPMRRQQSPWRTIRWVESAAPSVRRDAEQSDRDGRAPLFRLHRSGLVFGGPVTAHGRVAQWAETKVPAHHPQRQRKVFRLWRIRSPQHGPNEGPLCATAPNEIPDTATRDLAKAMLKVKGVGRSIP